LRGEDTEASDLDLLVDPLPGTTLFDLGAIQIELEEALGIRVDVLTPGDLPAKFRDHVLREAIPVGPRRRLATGTISNTCWLPFARRAATWKDRVATISSPTRRPGRP
jgi:hypothetical protein